MKKLLFFFALFFIVALSCFSLFFAKDFLKNSAKTEEDVCLELWHVDCFEGGIGSRRAYLEKLSKKFCESLNGAGKGRISVAVKQVTPLSLGEFFKKGIYPDLLSYGVGVQIPYDRLVKLDFSAGQVGVYNGEAYAAVWAQGGYVSIKCAECKKIEGVIICEQENANPLLCYELSVENKCEQKITLPSKEGVYEFYRRKNYALVGTQRDLYRLEGKMQIVAEPLEGYNDLYCCVSVINTGEQKSEGKEIGEIGENAEKIKKSLLLARYLCFSENAAPSSVGLLNYEGVAIDKSAPIGRLSAYSPKYALGVFTTSEQILKLKELTSDFKANEQIIKNMLKRLK